MKKCLISLLSIATISLTGSTFADSNFSSKSHWVSKSSDDRVLLNYDHKRHNMIIAVDYFVDGKKGCGIELANCGARDSRVGAGPGDIVICVPDKSPNTLGVFLKSRCNASEDEQLVAAGSVEYIK